MYNLLIKNIAYIVRFLFVIFGIQHREKNNSRNNNSKVESGFLVLYLLGLNLLEVTSFRIYIVREIFEIVVILCCCKWCCITINLCFDDAISVCYYFILYEIINIISNVIGGILSGLLTAKDEREYLIIGIAAIVKVILAYLVLLLPRKYFDISDKNWIIGCVYILITCIKIPFIFTDIKNLREFKLVIIFSICASVIFLIISKIDKHNAEKERAKIEENNKKLSSKLHKSQEILPAMVQVLSNVTENGGTEMEEQEAHKLLEEVSDLYGQQLKENSKEDLQLKNFCSTGLKLLDEQLKVYQMEALDRNVNLDIFVQAPINGIMKKDNIDQLKLQRAVGDLIRNAFRVMEREDKKCRAKGHILLIIGCQYEGILEIAVVDNGAEFPLHVIQAFGRRGVTTGGTGNGLADLVEFADETKASIRVDEFAWETSSFTKKISIIFDKQRMNYFNSSRRELIESSFWNNN